jgi:putative membrane protein
MAQIPAPPEDPRVRFAAERTLLAWVRTGVALMGFGFVVARFGLFLRELAATSASAHTVRPVGPSMVLGVGLTMLGVAVPALAGWEYRAVLRRIDRREPYQPPRVSLGLMMAAVLTALGLATASYLLTL